VYDMKRNEKETECREALIRYFDSFLQRGDNLKEKDIEEKTQAVVEAEGISITNYYRLRRYLLDKYKKIIEMDIPSGYRKLSDGSLKMV